MFRFAPWHPNDISFAYTRGLLLLDVCHNLLARLVELEHEVSVVKLFLLTVLDLLKLTGFVDTGSLGFSPERQAFAMS